MADPAKIQPIDKSADPYVDILKLMRELTKEQSRELVIAKQLSIENQLLTDLKKTHLTDEQKLVTLQTSVIAKTKEIVELEITKKNLLARGYHVGSVAIDGIKNNIKDLRKETRAAAKEFDAIHRKMVLISSGIETMNKIGLEEAVKFTKELRDNWASHPMLGMKTLLLKAIDIFNVLDTAAAKFRQEMGFTRKFTEGIDSSARQIAFNFAHIGVTAEIAYQAVGGITKNLFSSMSATTAMVRDISIMSAQLGISADESAEFMKNMGIAFRSTAGAQSNMVYFTAAMSEAAGVPLGEVMKDISSATKNSYQFVSRTGVSLVKAAIEARRMGTSLESATQTSRSLLNFTQNVKDEMEASVLVGKAINLQKARELAYHRDIRGLNKEILNIMKETDFENLDPFQQEAVAKALGKSAGELANMAQAERERLGWEKSTDPHVQAQLKAYKDMMAATESIANENGKNMRLQLQAKANQAAIASITQSWNAILNRIGEGVLPFIEMTLRGIAYVLGGINRFFGWINDGASSIAGWLGTVTKFIIGAAVAATLLVGMKGLGKLVSWATGGIGKGIGKMLGGIASGAGKFGKANILKAAIGIAALGAALYVFAKGIKPFADVKWGPVFIGVAALYLLGHAVSSLGKATTAMIKGAVGIAVLGGALWLFGKLSKPFAEINWKGMLGATLALAAVALVAGIMGAPPIIGFILMGAVAIAALGLALIPFAAAAWIASKALQNLSDVKWKDIATGIFRIGIQTPLIAGMGMAMLIAAPGIAAFSLALIPLSFIANRAGAGMMNLGAGLKMITESFGQLQNMSFIGTILQIKNLSSAIKDLSKVISAMPDISVEKLKAIALAGGGGEAAQKKDNTSEMLSAIKDAIDGLRTDFKNGAVTATVFLDSQKFDSAIGRRMIFTGALA